MSQIKEAIEKLQSALNQIDEAQPFCPSPACDILSNAGMNIDIALALFRKEPEQPEPKCKTCGDSGKVELTCTDNRQNFMVPEISKETIPCPDCTEQPPASEFTRKWRQSAQKYTFEKRSNYYVDGLLELCDRLDRAEAEIKKYIEMDKYKSQQSILATKNYNRICKQIEDLEASRNDLLEACKCALTSIKLRLICGKGEDPEMERDMIMVLLQAAIAKAKKGGQRMSKRIFSGKGSQKFWGAVSKSKSDIIYNYGCKAQEIESINIDLLEACKRAYFLLETNNVKDEYFEVLRLKLGDLLPSQIVSETSFGVAIAKAERRVNNE